MIALVGAGAMGAALALHSARTGHDTALLGTILDGPVIEALRADRPHPALGVRLPSGIEYRDHDGWDDVLDRAEIIVLAVSSAGFADVAGIATARKRDVIWAVATKGWDEASLRSPFEVLADALPATEHVVSIGGPALAAEIAAGAPTSIVCAANRPDIAARVAAMLQSPELSVTVSDDVAGVETSAAYKNVVAVAVGICVGLSERSPESVYVHGFANARAAIFARGLEDMSQLASARGGRIETVAGLAGAGDLYVTCLGGRNGTFGRLLGLGQTPQQAQETIGSTVEGIANTHAALAIAARLGINLPTARAVDSVLSQRIAPQAAITELMHTPAVTDLRPRAPIPAGVPGSPVR